MPFNSKTGCEENTGSQSHMTNTLCYGMELCGVEGGDMEGQGGQQQAEHDKYKVCQAQAGQQVVEDRGHALKYPAVRQNNFNTNWVLDLILNTNETYEYINE